MNLSLLRKKNRAEHFDPEVGEVRPMLRIVKPEPTALPTSDVKGSPSEHFNRPLYNQILQARQLLVSETGRKEKRL